MDETSWIVGLMKQNTNELGFIPSTVVQSRYISKGRFILQTDERGRRIGYLLHGPIYQGQPVYVSQHCIEYDKRLRGYGERAVLELKRRAECGGASSIHLRCGCDLEAVQFWQAQGFQIVRVVPGGAWRKRMIAEMRYLLPLSIFSK